MKGKEVKESIEDIVAYGQRLSVADLNEYFVYLRKQGFSLFWQGFGNRGDCLQYWERRNLLSSVEYVKIHTHPRIPMWFSIDTVSEDCLNLNYGRY